MKSPILIPIILLGAGLSTQSTAQTAGTAGGIEVGRYIRVSPSLSPDEAGRLANPMFTIVSLTFPRGSVETVGDAVNYLLMRSGYRIDADAGGEAHARLMTFALPESQRRLEYVTVEQALVLLGGESYAPAIDHVHRTVAFGLQDNTSDPNARIAGGAHAATRLAEKDR